MYIYEETLIDAIRFGMDMTAAGVAVAGPRELNQTIKWLNLSVVCQYIFFFFD